MLEGVDGEKALYGFVPARGNGCCTYVKEAWATAAGYTKADLQKQMSYDEYYTMLKKMKEAKGVDYVISAPGFYSKEAPYTNYLPEFYQNAQFTFYYDQAKGEYVDGFSEQEMKDALQRIQNAVKDGLINKESSTKTTFTSRNDFKSSDPKTESGVFTYWAGTWADKLKNEVMTSGLDGALTAILPIKELGKYAERLSPSWCITSHAAETGKAEGIFKYFIDKMLDGGDVQMLWTHGAKGTHWDDKAETVTVEKKEDQPKTYTEGQFHYLPGIEKPDQWQTKNHIDPILSIANFTNGYVGESLIPEVARENGEFFAENSQVAVPLPMTSELSNNIGDINTARTYVIAQVALGYMTVDEGMDYYNKTVGSLSNAVLKSLNK